nr:hypothetical protein Iba_chr13cCG16540 [Ipomoea batatas]
MEVGVAIFIQTSASAHPTHASHVVEFFSLSEQQKRMSDVLKIGLDDGLRYRKKQSDGGYEYNAPAASMEGDDGGYDYAPAA